jgi:hypothetical protein
MKNQQEVTSRVKLWIRDGLYTKTDFSSIIGMSRPTLDSRLKKSNWSKNEIDIIKTKCPF